MYTLKCSKMQIEARMRGIILTMMTTFIRLISQKPSKFGQRSLVI